MGDALDEERLNPLQRFGQDVKQVRLGRKLTQMQLGRAAGYSEGYVSKVESGKLLPLPSQRFAQGCDLAFGTNGLFSDLLRRIDEGDHPSWFLPYLQLERRATRILECSTILVTGMLQTEDYARALFRAAHPRSDPDTIESRTHDRLQRRRIFQAEKPPLFWVVLHEACLRTVVGCAEVMHDQVSHLIESAESPHVRVQILPFAAGAPAAHMKPFTVLRFSGSPDLLYTETRLGGRMHDGGEAVTAALDDYDLLRANALSLDDSLSLMTSLLKEYRA
ncbi:helix-turn-helix domain-containing protein [Streptomyces bohaiensis]|uniref:Helix-turn-helix transcriptional regulator n=1 Tax=Streptomyces bohaiensis TaxID=1431344 RepID=A0ABX1CCS1_9ACTN|nr:helix-turn-helix transcriptional regulator [Streptomyces bohaiensis]NJQ16905.1 helix-turn-helix transcriptional regulator [Streptomyces bohaiensis]